MAPRLEWDYGAIANPAHQRPSETVFLQTGFQDPGDLHSWPGIASRMLPPLRTQNDAGIAWEGNS